MTIGDIQQIIALLLLPNNHVTDVICELSPETRKLFNIRRQNVYVFGICHFFFLSQNDISFKLINLIQHNTPP